VRCRPLCAPLGAACSLLPAQAPLPRPLKPLTLGSPDGSQGDALDAVGAAGAARGALLQRPAADDVGDRKSSSWPKDACRFGKDPMFDRREVDHAVGDDDVEGGVVERESIDAGFRELDLGEPIAISQSRCLIDLLVREVDPDDASGRADLEGGAERIRSARAAGLLRSGVGRPVPGRLGDTCP
jgi:hypothetical protein